MKNLREATNLLYKVFSKYTIAGNLRERSCKCCVTDEEIKELLSVPLQQLTEDELGHFTRSALTTFGSIEDYKHFLPRILELLADTRGLILFDFLTFEKLNYSNWRKWEQQEVGAVEDYFIALWRVFINSKAILCNKLSRDFELMIRYIGIQKTLDIWGESENKSATIYLVDTLLYGLPFKLEAKDADIFTKWCFSPLVKNKLEKFYFQLDEEELAAKVSIAYTLLDNKQ